MATSVDRFCSLCDPSPIKADEWCSECDAFLCLDCLRHHRASKLSNQHATIPIKDYEELPDFVTALTYICEDHDERVESFCPVHNCPCCIRCALMSHKSCDGVAPLKDFTQDSKSSSSIKDIEQTLCDMHTHIERLAENKETNKQEMHAQQDKILEEVRQIRTSLNNHLDLLEQTLIDCLNEAVSETVRHIETVIHELTESKERIDKISEDLNIIKSHATDLQTFLSMPQITSKVIDEEKNIEDLTKSSKLGCKSVVFEAKVKEFTNSESFGDVHVKEDKCNIVYVKLKEKQAQIVGATPVTINNISLKLVKRLEIEVLTAEGVCNQITGCVILNNGNYIFSEYNQQDYIDRITLYNNNGRLIQSLNGHSRASLFDVTKIDDNVIAVSADNFVEIISIASGKRVSTIKFEVTCYGSSYQDDLLIVCSEEGIRTYNTKSQENKLLIKVDVLEFSYICSTGNHVFYTTGTESVRCCDMAGKVIWKYEDTSVLRSPRGVTVDKNGFCFVSGEASKNIVIISPDGKSSKEVCKVLSPTAICYDEARHQVLVCNTSEAFLFQISENM